MSDWQEKLNLGAITCRVFHDGEIVEVLTPTDVDQLWVPIYISDLGETAQGDFAYEFELFIESGKSAASYKCEACKTIVKFGQALQFKETFIVKFEAASRRLH